VRKSFYFYVFGGGGVESGDEREREIVNESVFFYMKVNVINYDPFPNPQPPTLKLDTSLLWVVQFCVCLLLLTSF